MACLYANAECGEGVFTPSRIEGGGLPAPPTTQAGRNCFSSLDTEALIEGTQWSLRVCFDDRVTEKEAEGRKEKEQRPQAEGTPCGQIENPTVPARETLPLTWQSARRHGSGSNASVPTELRATKDPPSSGAQQLGRLQRGQKPLDPDKGFRRHAPVT